MTTTRRGERARPDRRFVRTAATEIAWLLPIVSVCAAFALRPGPPAMRHDWLWPAEPHTFARWFVESALSEWNPHGLGSPGQTPSFNVVLAGFALMGVCGIPTNAILFAFLTATYVGAAAGIGRLIATLDIRLDLVSTRALGFAYAFGPIAFEKSVAGHIYWLAAYATLPWFAAAIWRGCSDATPSRGRIRAFLAAALLYVVAGTQIQFVVFDAFVVAAIAIVCARSGAAYVGIAFVAAVGILHNGNAALGPFLPHDEFRFNRFHATVSWEEALSSPLLELATFGGYFHYDAIAIGGPAATAFAAARALLAFLAVAGIVVKPDRRSLPFALVASTALVFASGWDGPLRGALADALHHSDLFTLVRELYHVMALYAFATVVLAALAIEKLPRAVARGTALAVCAVTLPFLTLGLNEAIPAIVPVASENEASYAVPTLRALLPEQEPMTTPGRTFGGLDPARSSDDVITSGDPSLAVRSIVESPMPRERQRALLADLGVTSIFWRPDRVSIVEGMFQPGTGATFTAFAARQNELRRRFATRAMLHDPRPTIALETPGAVSPLDTYLADAVVPPGRSTTLRSSYESNDIRSGWVSGRIWSFVDPAYDAVTSDPVLTQSHAPLALSLGTPTAEPQPSFLYALVAGEAPSLDGRAGVSIAKPTGAYRWYRWRLAPGSHAVDVRPNGETAVALAIDSTDGDWRPSRALAPPLAVARGVAAGVSRPWPWEIRATIPASPSARTIVFCQLFESGWHLDLDGTDLGPARRTHGLFDGWTIPATRVAEPIRIYYAPQAAATAIFVASIAVEATIVLALLVLGSGSRVRSTRAAR